MLSISVLRNVALGDCSNNGISARFSRLEMIEEKDVNTYDGNLSQAVVKIDRILWGEKKPVLVPFEVYSEYKNDTLPISFGGNFGWSSDSRFGGTPIPIHDRLDTWEAYDALSR